MSCFKNSVVRGKEQFNLIGLLSNTEIVNLRHNTAKPKSTYIAESIFNRIPPAYSFSENMKRYIEERRNVAFHNRNIQGEVAYFRYTDGSTTHLFGQVAYHSAPCTTCSNPLKCKCLLELDL